MMTVFIIILFDSCVKENNDLGISDVVHVRSSGDGCIDSISTARFDFGNLLYKSLSTDAVFANYIKQKMELEYNSDYSFLYIKEKSKIVYSGKTVEDILIENSGIPAQQCNNLLNEILCTDPLLTISMSDLENLSVLYWTSNIPAIAAIKECQESKYTLFDSNNPNGSTEQVLDPTFPTINIISSEIYYAIKNDGTTNKGLGIDEFMPQGSNITTILDCSEFTALFDINSPNYYPICGQNYVVIEHNELLEMYINCFNLNGTLPPPSPPSSPPCPCDRDCEELDELLVDFKIKNWGVYKNCANKFWEVKFVFHGNVVGAKYYNNGMAIPHASKYVSQTLKKGDLLDCSGVCVGKWISANYRIWTDWDQSELGSPYYIDW